MTTDPVTEERAGRVALWLDPDDLRWLAETCACNDDADEHTIDRCARIRFRAHAALHKSGLKNSAGDEPT